MCEAKAGARSACVGADVRGAYALSQIDRHGNMER